MRSEPQEVRKILRKLGAACGVDDVHPHCFRRTLATRLIEHGAPIQIVAEILGHDRLDTTMKYVHQSKLTVEQSYRKYS